MKAQIHPAVFTNAQVVCSSCGTTFSTISTKERISVEVCSHCHPFFTGEHKFLDAQGRVEHFQKKQEVAAKMKAKSSAKKDKKRDGKGDSNEPKSLKELLSEI